MPCWLWFCSLVLGMARVYFRRFVQGRLSRFVWFARWTFCLLPVVLFTPLCWLVSFFVCVSDMWFSLRRGRRRGARSWLGDDAGGKYTCVLAFHAGVRLQVELVQLPYCHRPRLPRSLNYLCVMNQRASNQVIISHTPCEAMLQSTAETDANTTFLRGALIPCASFWLTFWLPLNVQRAADIVLENTAHSSFFHNTRFWVG